MNYTPLYKFTCGFKTNKSSGQHALTLKIYEYLEHVPRATFIQNLKLSFPVVINQLQLDTDTVCNKVSQWKEWRFNILLMGYITHVLS